MDASKCSMSRQELVDECMKLFRADEGNKIPENKALAPELAHMKMFEEPLIGIAAAQDKRFAGLKAEDVVGGHFLLPSEWLPQAKTVISLFFPFTRPIIDSNKADIEYPSKAWLNGRIEGQEFIDRFIDAIADRLRMAGAATVVPTHDARFSSNTGMGDAIPGRLYSSNWSERHVAYVCGIGTFSLSAGLITEKGVAGRLASVITEAEVQPDEQVFSSFDENCIKCGKCIGHCPVGALSLTLGKDHEKCAGFLSHVLSKDAPRYACGKCQVGVPCESENPQRRKLADR